MPDPYVFGEWAQGNARAGNRNLTGKVARDPRRVGEERIGVFVCAGQSNASNFVNVQYTPTHAAKIDNLNVYDGGYYAATDPLLGCESANGSLTVGNIFLRMADQLITRGLYDRVVLIPVAVAGQPVAQLKTPFGDRITVAFRRAAALGLTVTAVLYQQGEYDTDTGTTQATYLADLQAGIAKPRAKGFSAPWLVAKCSYLSPNGTSAAVRAAQAAVVNGTDIFAGPDTDTLLGANRWDGTHFSGAGAIAAGGLWADVIQAAFVP